MNTPDTAENPGRRQFLRAAGLTVALAGTAGVAKTVYTIYDAVHPKLYTEELEDLRAAAAQYPEPHMSYWTTPPPREQMAVSSNTKLQGEPGAQSKRAYVVVHPGYFTTQVNKDTPDRYDVREPVGYSFQWEPAEKEETDRWNIRNLTALLYGSEGNYGAYRANLAKLLHHLRETKDPVVLYLEQRATPGQAKGTIWYDDLDIPPNAVIVVTEEGDPEAVPVVKYKAADGHIMTERQSESFILSWFRTLGVEEVHVAGEMGLSRSGGVRDACLGAVALMLQDEGLDVHGIEGAVFPSLPLALQYPETTRLSEYDLKRWGLVAMLHLDTVPMPTH